MNMLTNDIFLSVIVPFKNEVHLVSNLDERPEFQAGVSTEFIYVDDGSTDGGGDILARLRPAERILRLSGVGTGKAFHAGAEMAQGRYVFLLPIDCRLSVEAMRDLAAHAERATAGVLVFPKRYTSARSLGLYAIAQNTILLRWLRMASWTNGFVLRRDLLPVLRDSVQEVFLNDLELSRRLKSAEWHVLKHEISVSPRRYANDGALRRIFLNGLVVMLWQLRLASTPRLLKLYKRGRE